MNRTQLEEEQNMSFTTILLHVIQPFREEDTIPKVWIIITALSIPKTNSTLQNVTHEVNELRSFDSN